MRHAQLVVTKRRATGLLVLVTIVFVATIRADPSSWVGFVQATAAASMVGGLADWFAVVALFRHPLGLPIPHTAIVVERKDQFGATLSDFIQESFLTPEIIVERVRAAAAVPRVAHWLSQPENASRVAAELVDAAVAVSEVLRDEDTDRTIEGFVRQGIEAVPLAPFGARILRFLGGDRRADEIVDRIIAGVSRYLEVHQHELRRTLATRSHRWMPGAVDRRLFDRVIEGAREVLAEMEGNPTHSLRNQLNARLLALAHELETSPILQKKGEELKHELLSRPEMAHWVASLRANLKRRVEGQAADPDSALRARLTDAVMSVGRRLQYDPALEARVERGFESLAAYVARHFKGAIANVVTTTVSHWDAAETSSRLELLLGPDLQYVRINGTVVGGGAGLLLHAIARLIG